ncbi:MAG: glycoside hydrolase family 2 TIM barrel-domain containing protein [Planctomycetota bacterium]
MSSGNMQDDSGGAARAARWAARIRSVTPWMVVLGMVVLALLPGCGILRGGWSVPEPATTSHSLEGTWSLWLDPGAVGLADHWAAALCAGERPATAPADPLPIAVPGPLEAHSATQSYDGVVWYERRLRAPLDLDDAYVALHFGQVNYACRIFLDGHEVGRHEGGYDAFAVDLTGWLRPGREHGLAVMVLDPGAVPTFGLTLKATPHSKESWYENFGGLLGPVSLRVERGWRTENVRVVARVAEASAAPPEHDWLQFAARLLPPAAAGGSSRERAVLRLEHEGVEVARGEQELAVRAGQLLVLDWTLPVPGARRWSPEEPALYRALLEIDGQLVLERTVGFRTVSLDERGFLLNGQRRVLKGVLYQPHDTGRGGMPPSAAELEATVLDMKATGFDLVRAHVRPAPPALLEAADRHGLLVLEEPAFGWMDEDAGLLPRLRAELDWMVARDHHHPSIVMWGLLNELSGKAYQHAEELTRYLAELDPTRPVLEDSGGFFGGGRYLAPLVSALPTNPVATSAEGSAAPAPRAVLPMIDRHCYPPWPLPLHERDGMASLDEPTDVAGLAGLGGLRDGEALHLPEGARLPVFVSEFGYGTLLETVPTVTRFREQPGLSAERVLFESYAAVARRARQSGEAWTTEPVSTDRNAPSADSHWVTVAAEEQADAAEDLIEALRSNPALDLLCYTQWQAVHAESSAGVLSPWGASRPVRARLQRALRPLQVTVLAERPAVLVGESARCRVAIVNDGAEVQGRLVLEVLNAAARSDAADRAEVARTVATVYGPFPRGVRSVTVTIPASEKPAVQRLRARLLDPSGSTLDLSTEREVLVLAPPRVAGAEGRAAFALPADAAARAALARLGLALVEDLETADIMLLSDPALLSSEAGLGFEQRLRLWDFVWRGGGLLVQLPHPGESKQARILGLGRAVTTLTQLPQPLGISGASGNFMGRLQLVREPSGARALGRGDEVLSPVAMLVSGLPARVEDEAAAGVEVTAITLGTLGNRLGATEASLPFGRGRIHVLGLPLMQPLGENVEPRRDTELAERLAKLLAAMPHFAPPAVPSGETSDSPRLQPSALGAFFARSEEDRLAVAKGFARLERVASLADRHSLFGAAAGQPLGLQGPVVEGIARRQEALQALLTGDLDGVLRGLSAAMDAVWTERTEDFLQLEQRVLAALAVRVAAGSHDDWNRAYTGMESWVRGIVAWHRGEVKVAFDWLGRADLALADA